MRAVAKSIFRRRRRNKDPLPPERGRCGSHEQGLKKFAKASPHPALPSAAGVRHMRPMTLIPTRARAALVALPLLALCVAGAAMAQQSPAAVARTALTQTVLTGPERAAALTAASAALNKLVSVQGRFAQIAPDGARSGGAFYLQRPGRLRFQYDAPSPLTIVSDGSTVAVEDRSVRDVSRVPLRSTPLFYVLKRDVSLERDARITRVVRNGDLLMVTARDRTGEADGEITLAFSASDYQLRQWEVTDAQSLTTRITLSELRAAERLDPRLFRLEPEPRQGRKAR